MTEIVYKLTPFQAIAVDECLNYLRKLELVSTSISSEAVYTPEEIEALLLVMNKQHSKPELLQAYVENGGDEELL